MIDTSFPVSYSIGVSIFRQNTMGNRLVDQFFQAIKEWSERTKVDPSTLFMFAGISSGLWEQIDSRNYPVPDHDLAKAQYHYLNFLIEEMFVSPDTLICGLVKAVEMRFVYWIETFDEKREQSLESYERLRGEGAIEDLKRAAESLGDQDAFEWAKSLEENSDRISQMIEGYRKALNDPNINKAEFQMQLKIWQEVTQPIMQNDNLLSAIIEMGGLRSDKPGQDSD